MAGGKMSSTLMYVGAVVAVVAVVALIYYGSPSAAMHSVGMEGFASEPGRKGFVADEDDEEAPDADNAEQFEDAGMPAVDEEDDKEPVPPSAAAADEGFYGGYDSSNKDYAAAGGAGGPAAKASTDFANCYTRDGLNPSDLLPEASAEASQFLASNPPTKGSPDNRNLLQAGYHIGIDTVCQTNKNANLQLRSDPPIARCNPSGAGIVFNASSIPAQQNNRLVLEIGSQVNPEGCADFKKDSMYPH